MPYSLPSLAWLYHIILVSTQQGHNPDSALTPTQLRAEALQAFEWPALAMPTAALSLNLQLQLLATLDHEFGAHYLPTASSQKRLFKVLAALPLH